MKNLYILIIFAFVFQISNAQKLNTNIIKTIENQGASITGVKFTPDSKQFIVFNDKNELSVYDVAYDKFVLNKKIKENRIESFKKILITKNQDIYFYTVNENNGLIVDFYKLSGNSFSKDFSYNIPDTKKYGYWLGGVSPNLKYLIVSRRNHKTDKTAMFIYEINNKIFKKINTYKQKSVRAYDILFSKDNQYFLNNTTNELFSIRKHKIKVFQDKDYHFRKIWKKEIYSGSNLLEELNFNGSQIYPDFGTKYFIDFNKNYVYSLYNGVMKFYDFEGGELKKQAESKILGGYNDLSNDGKYFVSAYGPEIRLYYVNDGRFQFIFKHIDEIVENEARLSKFSPNSRYLATYSWNDWSYFVVKVYDFENNITLINQIRDEVLIGFVNDNTLLTRGKGNWYKFYSYKENNISVDSTYSEIGLWRDEADNLIGYNVFIFEKDYYKKYKSHQSCFATQYKIKNNKFEKIKTVSVSYKFFDAKYNNGMIFSKSGKYAINIDCGSGYNSSCYYNVFDVKNNFTNISKFNTRTTPGDVKLFSNDDKYLFLYDYGSEPKLYAYYNSGNNFSFLQEINVPAGLLYSIEVSNDNKYMVMCVGNKFHIMQIDGEH